MVPPSRGIEVLAVGTSSIAPPSPDWSSNRISVGEWSAWSCCLWGESESEDCCSLVGLCRCCGWYWADVEEQA